MKTIAVLGAGMVGTGTALALQARGFNVVLLDRASPGTETSHGCAGIIQGEACEPYSLPRDFGTLFRIAAGFDNSVDWDVAGLLRLARPLFSYWRHSAPTKHSLIGPLYAPLARRATQDHAMWIAVSGSEELIRREGYRVIFRDEVSFETQARNAARLRDRYGVEFDSESSIQLAAAEPALLQPLAGSIRWRDAWTCSDPGALVQAYAAHFARSGGTVKNAAVLSLEQYRSGWRVHSDVGAIDAEQVVVALGPWSPQILAPLGYKIEMVRKRGYHLNFEYPREKGAAWLNAPLLDNAFGAVYVPLKRGIRIATGADLSATLPEHPRQLRRAEVAARQLLEFGGPADPSFWTGVRPCMPDMLPVVGAAPRHRGLWFNFGHGHQGFTLGPTTGEILAEAIAQGTSDGFRSLAPARLFPG